MFVGIPVEFQELQLLYQNLGVGICLVFDSIWLLLDLVVDHNLAAIATETIPSSNPFLLHSLLDLLFFRLAFF